MTPMLKAEPLAVTLIVFGGLAVPTATAPKFNEEGDSVKGGTAVPERFTSCGLDLSLSAMVRIPFVAPSNPEMYARSIVQESPGCTVEQLLAIEKPPLAATEEIVRGETPTFVTVTVWVALVLFTSRGGKVKLAGAILICAVDGRASKHKEERTQV
jgi:hypothetical protein